MRIARRPLAAAALCLLVGALALLAVACGDDDTATTIATPGATSTGTATAAPGVVRIGVVQSLTGAGAAYGKPAVEGIELAAKQVNADASSGVTFELTVVDDASSVERVQTAVAELIATQVDVIVGPTLSNLAADSHRLAQDARIPIIGATTTGAGITDAGDYSFRIALPESVVVPATLARVARETSLKQAVLVLDGNDAFSRSSAAAMRSGLAAQGGIVLAEIDLSKTGIAEDLARVQGQAIDVFLVTPLVEPAAQALRAIRDAGFRQPVVGGNSFNTLDIARLAGAAVEGAYVGAAWNPGVERPTSRAFVQAFTSAYGRVPDLFAAQGFTSVQVLLDAVRRASGPAPAALRDALAGTRDLDTPLGRLSMSPKREAEHQPVTQQYRNSQLVVVP